MGNDVLASQDRAASAAEKGRDTARMPYKPEVFPAFTVRNLSFAYGENRVFEDLSLTVPEGKVTTIIGANGSGKTTLFGLMTKELTPDAGSVYLRRGNVSAIRRRDFARLVAVVHQHNIAPADLPVRKLVGYGRNPYRSPGAIAATENDEAWIDFALGVTNLKDLAERPMAELSGGQSQRVWIAMALAQGARVLLLDEPTTYLDVRYQLDVLHLVRRLNREFHFTVLMVLHDINQALAYSDEIVALAQGRLVSQGAPDEVVSPQLLREVYGIPLDVESVGGKPFVMMV